ncbi:hypothetical protein E2C01_031048 [Portunus trituberculatus]|uniref:Uncharacterized protein n=1 Tax=Portunus trituberculatus TaxID=210409 RepID=A0A5B7ETG2_PORTR|nr:hypothetical protein [Portunus trituberculatus]
MAGRTPRQSQCLVGATRRAASLWFSTLCKMNPVIGSWLKGRPVRRSEACTTTTKRQEVLVVVVVLGVVRAAPNGLVQVVMVMVVVVGAAAAPTPRTYRNS